MVRATVVLADDHPLFLEGVALLLEREPDFRVVARCADGEEALAAVREHRPDLLIADLQMPRLGGLDLLRRAVKEELELRAILLAADVGDDDMLDAIALGVRGVVLKDMAPDLIVRCARTVIGGGQWIERRLMGRAMERLLSRDAARQRQQVEKLLTPREVELVRLVSEGLRNKEIAIRLKITESTVKVHVHRIYEKLGVTSRVELANYARREGL